MKNDASSTRNTTLKIPRKLVSRLFPPLPQLNTPWNTDHTFGSGIAPFYDVFTKIMFLILGYREEHLRRFALVDALEKTGGIKNIHAAIDIGCGTGEHTLALQWALQKHECQITGIDISPHMIFLARKKKQDHQTLNEARYKPRVSFKMMDAANMPFTTNSIDLITASLSFHEFSPLLLHDVLNECHRILKPDGRLIIFDYGDRVVKKPTFLTKLAYYIIMQIETWKTQYYIRCGRKELFTLLSPMKLIYQKYHAQGIFMTTVFQPIKE